MGQIGVPSGDPDLELAQLRRRMEEMDRRSATAEAVSDARAPRGLVAWHKRTSSLYPMTGAGSLWRVCRLSANMIKGRLYRVVADLGIYENGSTYPAYSSLDVLTFWSITGEALTTSAILQQSNLFLDGNSIVHSHTHEADIDTTSLPGAAGDVIPLSVMFVARPVHAGINYGIYASGSWPMRFRIEDWGLGGMPFTGVDYSG